MDSIENSSLHLTEVLSWTWKALVILLLVGNLKNVPFFWHVRVLKGYRQLLKSNRPRQAPKPSQLFQPMIMGTHSPLMELDYNFHKSNSTYFSDVDIARSHLCCTLFANGVEKARHTKLKSLGYGGDGILGLALGSVCCSFKHEIPAYSSYEMWTRILSWDEKWLYVVTHFVRKGSVTPSAFTLYPGQSVYRDEKGYTMPKNAIMASAVSKCVWKKGRQTVSPEQMLELAGLLPPRPEGLVLKTLELDEPGPKSLLGKAEEYLDIPFKTAQLIETVWQYVLERLSPDAFTVRNDVDERANTGEWTWELMEAERMRGMKIAKSLQELSKADETFTGEASALGWQSDTW